MDADFFLIEVDLTGEICWALVVIACLDTGIDVSNASTDQTIATGLSWYRSIGATSAASVGAHTAIIFTEIKGITSILWTDTGSTSAISCAFIGDRTIALFGAEQHLTDTAAADLPAVIFTGTSSSGAAGGRIGLTKFLLIAVWQASFKC